MLQLLGITALHFVASVAALLWSFGTASKQFDNRPVSWISKHFAAPVTEVLWFPLATAAQALNFSFVRGHPAVQYLVLLANSFLWATALFLAGAMLVRQISKRPSRKHNAAQAKGGVRNANPSPPNEA
jgi:magnesium-transporting ATPase (P-type)